MDGPEDDGDTDGVPPARLGSLSPVGAGAGPGVEELVAEVPAELPAAMAEGGASRRATRPGSVVGAAPATLTANTKVPTAPAAASRPTPVSARRRPGTRS
jgi:hypothetical protein